MPKNDGQRKSTVFLGAGRITSALIAGLRLAQYHPPIAVYDRNPEKLQDLRRQYSADVAPDLKTALSCAKSLIIAVRPASVPELLDQIAKCGALPRTVLVISVAAGIPVKALRARLGKKIRIVRATPSPVSRMGRGLTAISFGRDIPIKDRQRVRELFENVGSVVEVPENRLNIFNATFSPGHGYHSLETLAHAAQRAGLDRKTSLAAAAHALADAIAYWRQSGQSVASLLHESATPGGTTAATLAAMDRAGYSTSITQGLKTGIKQARSNADFMKQIIG